MLIKPPGQSKEVNFTCLDGSLIAYISSDGRTVLFIENSDGGEADGATYVRKTDGSPATSIGIGHPKEFSHDGKQILSFLGDTLIGLVPTGAGEITKISVTMHRSIPLGFFPDGKHILVQGRETDKSITRLYIMDLSGKNFRPLIKEFTPSGVEQKLLSPDGKSVFALSTDRKY